MPVVQQMVHPRSLNFLNQQKVVMLRDKDGSSWETIAGKVRNLKGEKPTWKTVSNVYSKFNKRKGARQYQYFKCGRTATVFTPAVKKYLVQRLRELRKVCVCTSTTLARDLAAEKGVIASAAGIRKVLNRAGYQWLPRRRKRKYTKEQREKRVTWCEQTLEFSPLQLRQRLSLAMDGVVIQVPPHDPVDRHNFCWHGTTHMYRTRAEGDSEEFDANNNYPQQRVSGECVPLWGGISDNGFALVTVHAARKLDSEQWVAALTAGKLKKALLSLHPNRKRGPWHVLCDNETFLKSRQTLKAYEAQRVVPWYVPALSPDLNPVEKFWAWLRRRLRALDLKDLKEKRRPLTKAEYQARVLSVCRSAKARAVAKSLCRGLLKVCREVVRRKGAASSG